MIKCSKYVKSCNRSVTKDNPIGTQAKILGESPGEETPTAASTYKRHFIQKHEVKT